MGKKKKQKKAENRYNFFQKELSNYVKENKLPKGAYKNYKSLYKNLDKNIPIKRIGISLDALIKKFYKEDKVVKIDYAEEFSFYNAKGEFSLIKYSNVVLDVKFSDGGLNLDWSGTSFDFMNWFSGDIFAYFRNNYNESPVAQFVFKKTEGNVLYYEIEVGGSVYGTPYYVPPDKDIVIKDKSYRENKDNAVLRGYMQDKANLIKELRLAGYSLQEIQIEVKRLDDRFYGK